MVRHAYAPGTYDRTYDPPGFDLQDCAMQCNLSPEGRAEAIRLGTTMWRIWLWGTIRKA
jgi:hypothetical protein